MRSELPSGGIAFVVFGDGPAGLCDGCDNELLDDEPGVLLVGPGGEEAGFCQSCGVWIALKYDSMKGERLSVEYFDWLEAL